MRFALNREPNDCEFSYLVNFLASFRSMDLFYCLLSICQYYSMLRICLFDYYIMPSGLDFVGRFLQICQPLCAATESWAGMQVHDNAYPLYRRVPRSGMNGIYDLISRTPWCSQYYMSDSTCTTAHGSPHEGKGIDGDTNRRREYGVELQTEKSCK